MFEDLQKTIDLAYTPRGAPNFMLALVLCCYTEFWGRLLKGYSEGYSRQCFECFFNRLGPNYANLKRRGVDLYKDIRCGLAHSALIDGDASIDIGRGTCGITYDAATRHYTFYVATYFEDFRSAVNSYIRELDSGVADLSAFEAAMAGKPELV